MKRYVNTALKIATISGVAFVALAATAQASYRVIGSKGGFLTAPIALNGEMAALEAAWFGDGADDAGG
jgi:hypothetical protein